MNRTRWVAVFALMMAVSPLWTAEASRGGYFVYFGTYTGFQYISHGDPIGRSQSKGIYISRFWPATGELTEPQLAAEIPNPSVLAVDRSHRYLYAVSEDPLSLGPARDKASYVYAYGIDPATGKLTLLNTVAAHGASTCYLSLDRAGRFVMLANFGSGSITVLQINKDGSLGEPASLIRHTGKGFIPPYDPAPHPHSIDTSADNRFAVVSDLGLSQVFIYRFDSITGSLTPANPPSINLKPVDGGPRHFVFAPNGKHAYLLSEMSGTVTAFAWDAAGGVLTEIQSIPGVPADFTGKNNSAEIAVHPNGKFLYTSNRGPDSIAVFAVDLLDGTLKGIQHESTRGIMPRSFAIDPTGTYVLAANQVTDSVVLLRLDPATGRLSGTRTAVRVETPVSIQFVPIE